VTAHLPEMVWLDLDDTLFDHSYSVACGLERIQRHYDAFAVHRLDKLVHLYNAALNEVYPAYLCGDIDFQEMRRRKFVRFCHKAGIAAAEAPDVAVFHRMYDDAYGRTRRAIPGSVEGVQRLRDLGIGIRVLTNGIRHSQEEKLRIIGLESLIPYLLTSEEAGAAKPDSRIFRWALQKTNKAARDVVMIGDNPINDVEGALSAGIRALYYSRGAVQNVLTTPFGPALVFSDWEQIPGMLQQPDAASEAGQIFSR
jgi:putative hydrolase of the HAD superfamily